MPRLDHDRAKIQRGTLESREENEILASSSRLRVRPRGSAVNYLRMRTMVPADARTPCHYFATPAGVLFPR